MVLMRPKTLAAVLASSSVLMLAACSGTSASDDSLKVGTYGGSYGEGLRTCIFEPFTKKSGVEIVPSEGDSYVTLSKLQQSKGNPALDVAWMDLGVPVLARDAGVLESIPLEEIKDADDLDPKSIFRNEAGEVDSLGTGYFGTGIIYNTEAVKTVPTSWDDLWSEEYAGKVAAPLPKDNPAFFSEMARVFGNGPDDVDAAIARFQKLDAVSYIETSGQSENLLTSGEAVVIGGYAGTAWSLAEEGFPAAYVVPDSGSIAGNMQVHLVRGTHQRAQALELISYAVSTEAQECLAEELFVGPVNNAVRLDDPKIEERLPWGRGGSVDDLALPDWEVIMPQREEWARMFNEEVQN